MDGKVRLQNQELKSLSCWSPTFWTSGENVVCNAVSIASRRLSWRKKKINAADVVLSSCETHQGETSALVLCLKKEKKTIHTSLLPFFIWQGGGVWGEGLGILLSLLSWSQKRLAEGLSTRTEPWVACIIFTVSWQLIRWEMWLLCCQIRSCGRCFWRYLNSNWCQEGNDISVASDVFT